MGVFGELPVESEALRSCLSIPPSPSRLLGIVLSGLEIIGDSDVSADRTDSATGPVGDSRVAEDELRGLATEAMRGDWGGVLDFAGSAPFVDGEVEALAGGFGELA